MILIKGKEKEIAHGVGGKSVDSPLGQSILRKMTNKWSVNSLSDYLREIHRIPRLTPSEEIELARDIQKWKELEGLLEATESSQQLTEAERLKKVGLSLSEWKTVVKRGERAQQKMIKSNLRLVVAMAKKYQDRGLELTDLIQEGSMGLMRGVEKFDYRQGYRFSTYAVYWIKQAITRSIANQSRTIRLPIHIREKMNQLKKAYRELELKYGRKPTEEEVSEYLTLTVEQIAHLFQVTRQLSSLDQQLGEESEICLGDVLEDSKMNGKKKLEQLLISQEIEEYLERLTERERQIIDLYYWQDLSLAKIGEQLKISRERVRQIHQKALKKIRYQSSLFRRHNQGEEV